MDREQLEKRIEELQRERSQLVSAQQQLAAQLEQVGANLNANAGAINECRRWLAVQGIQEDGESGGKGE